jgi:hypothetical protein
MNDHTARRGTGLEDAKMENAVSPDLSGTSTTLLDIGSREADAVEGAVFSFVVCNLHCFVSK